MLTQENLTELLQTSLRSGGDFAEVFIEEAKATTVSCEDNKIEKISSGTEVGAGIRVISGKETAYVASSDTGFGALRAAALKISESVSGNKIKVKELTPQVSNQGLNIKRRPNQVSMDEKTAKVELLNKTARSHDGKIKQVTVRYTDSNQAITVANSDGLYVEDNRIRTRYYINVIAAKDHTLQTGYEAPGGTVGFELFDQYPAEEYAKRAAERALLMLDAPHAPAGKMMVVMSSEAGGTLVHEACGHGMEADFIMKGTSVYAGKIGSKVASDVVTVIDDGTLPGKFGTYAFDDEGSPAKKTILIENGILKSYLTDRYTANIVGLEKTGNGRRQSFHSKPQPRMRNTFIAPGNTDPQEIIDSVKNGFFVKHMGGGQVNVTNGDFVFDVTEGYLIENGKIKHPVRGATLIGNGPKILEIIDLVGSDLGFTTGVCGKYDHAPVSTGQPTIRIPEVTVGGRI
ncbi:TldD/PmbA family protein [Candidatus Margulisiibacteriota bacterium]